MNTLTKNRIIEKGDEYRDNGTWKTVPDNDIGLQIMFTKYAEVRRPSEEPPSTQGSVAATRLVHTQETVGSIPTPAKPISPDRERTPQKSASATAARSPAKAESDTSTPAPSHSGAGGSHDHAVSYLPTVVSPKAHGKPPTLLERIASRSHDHAVVNAMVNAMASINDSIQIDWPDTAPHCIWTGRNGTFRCRAVNFHKRKDGQIQIVPVGKRGAAKNAIIEFPASEIPRLIHWLMAQKETTPK